MAATIFIALVKLRLNANCVIPKMLLVPFFTYSGLNVPRFSVYALGIALSVAPILKIVHNLRSEKI